MASTDARPVPRKNIAFRYYFSLRKNDGTIITSWTGADSEVSIDGAAFSDCTNEATEIGSSGCGYIDLTSSEMNGDGVMLKMTFTNTGALPYVVTFFPEETGDYRIDASALATASALADVQTDTNDIQSRLPAALVSGRIDASVGAMAANVMTAAAAAADLTTELQSGLATASAVSTLQTSVDDLPTNAELATALGTADDAVLAALATTDGKVDGIKAKTDSLTFTVAGQVDANIQSINDVTIVGDGSGTPFNV